MKQRPYPSGVGGLYMFQIKFLPNLTKRKYLCPLLFVFFVLELQRMEEDEVRAQPPVVADELEGK